MFKRIIIGVEEHDGGKDAIRLAGRLAGPSTTLSLVTVYPDATSIWGSSNRIFQAVEVQHAHDVLTRLRQTTGVNAKSLPVAATSPGRGLHLAAEQENADLLVLGSSRRGLLGQVMLGNDTREALNGAPCPVVIAPAGYARQAGGIGRIGVGYKGTPESEHALAVARTLAADLDAKLSAMEAVEIPTYAFTATSMPVAGDLIEEMVDEALRRVSSLPGVEPHAAYGRPAEELTQFSGTVDLLVLGSRGYGPLGRLVHGSTTSMLAGSARCPLLVLTREASLAIAEPEVNGAAAFGDQSAWVSASLTQQ